MVDGVLKAKILSAAGCVRIVQVCRARVTYKHWRMRFNEIEIRDANSEDHQRAGR